MNIILILANFNDFYNNLPLHEKIGVGIGLAFLLIIVVMILNHLLTDVASKDEIRKIVREELEKFFEKMNDE